MTDTGAQAREAARVLLLDGDDRVLLFRWTYPTSGESWWITPGGGLDPGESHADGALRELLEETGLRLAAPDLHGPVFERSARIPSDDGGTHLQHELFYLARVTAHEVDTSGFTAVETASMLQHRWWTRAELAATAERIAPANLLELLP